MEAMLENATFICGHRKTGTTLLLCLLDNHPELLVYPADSGFFNGYYPIFDSLTYTDGQKIDRMAVFVVNELEKELKNLSESDRKTLRFPLNAMRHDLRIYAAETAKRPRDMLMSLMRAYRKHFTGSPKAIRWVEKTTSSEMYAAKALEWFPRAKFIHVIRDPRDNWGSLKSGWSKLYYKFNDSLDRLMHQMIERGKLGLEFARNNEKRFGPDVYKIIRFEDLTTHPERVLTGICDFLGITYSETMLIPTVCGKLWKGNSFEGRKFTKPSPVNVGNWCERITKGEACLIEYYLGDLMEYFGYETVSSIEQRMDAASKHYADFDARRLVTQLFPEVLKSSRTDAVPENHRTPKPDCHNGIYVFKVSLGKIWRRIAIPGTLCLDDLSSSILEAFSFDHDHLYCFTYNDHAGVSVDVNHPDMNTGAPWTDEVRIGELPLKPGISIRYLYDFGADWEFDVIVEDINPVDPEFKEPVILETPGNAPKQYPDRRS